MTESPNPGMSQQSLWNRQPEAWDFILSTTESLCRENDTIAGWRERLSEETGGIFLQADVTTQDIPVAELPDLMQVIDTGGTTTFNLATLSELPRESENIELGIDLHTADANIRVLVPTKIPVPPTMEAAPAPPIPSSEPIANAVELQPVTAETNVAGGDSASHG